MTSSRSAPGAVIKVARRTAFHVLKHDADRATCMAVMAHISSNVVGVRCVPYRRSAQCTWCTDETSTDVVSDGGRRDQREGGCWAGPGPAHTHRGKAFRALSASVRPRSPMVVMDCRRRLAAPPTESPCSFEARGSPSGLNGRGHTASCAVCPRRLAGVLRALLRLRQGSTCAGSAE